MTPGRGIAALRAFARPRGGGAKAAARCELCAAPICDEHEREHEHDYEHEHVLDRELGAVRCACRACAVLFEGGAGGRWRRVPRVAERLDGFRLDDALWDALGIPIGLAFIARRDDGAAIARYPSPGGAIEAAVPPDAYAALVAANPALATLAPEVEALLVRRLSPLALSGAAPEATRSRRAHDAYRVSIDVCYRLVGLVRLEWRGFSGGDAMWRAIDLFFDDLGANDA
jgi:hypothetical protein